MHPFGRSTENSDSEALAQTQLDVLNKMIEWMSEDWTTASGHVVTASIVIGFAALVALFA